MSDDVRRKSVWRAMALLAVTAFIYLAGVVSIMAAPIWAWPVLVPTTGLVLAILFVIGHDAAHGSLTPYPWLNQLLGRIVFIPAFHNFSGWVHAHNNVHHGWTNFQPKDYVWAPLSREQYLARGAFGRWWYRLGRWWPAFGVYYSVDILFRKITFVQADVKSPRVRWRWRFDALLLGVGLATQAAAILLAARVVGITTHPALLLIATMLVPAFICQWLLGFLTYLHHTHPAIPWFTDRSQWSFYMGQVRGTTHVHFPAGINRVIHNIMEHTAHHVDQSIPLYRLPEAQRQLESKTTPVISVFTPRSFFYIQHACQLYDFQNHRWLNYAGEPTSTCTVAEEFLAPRIAAPGRDSDSNAAAVPLGDDTASAAATAAA